MSQAELELKIERLNKKKKKEVLTLEDQDRYNDIMVVLEAEYPFSKYVRLKKEKSSVTLEDLPEDIIRSIAYRAKNGNQSILLYDKKHLDAQRENALKEIRRYKEAKALYQSAENEKNEFKALADKLGIDLTKY